MGYGDNKYKVLESESPEMQHAKKVLQDPALRAQIKVSFKKRKLTFRLVTLCLFIAVAFSIYTITIPANRDWFVPFMVIVFFIIYHISGVIIFRCPACNFGLSFSRIPFVPVGNGVMIPTGDNETDWSSKDCCPRCRNQLS